MLNLRHWTVLNLRKTNSVNQKKKEEHFGCLQEPKSSQGYVTEENGDYRVTV